MGNSIVDLDLGGIADSILGGLGDLFTSDKERLEANEKIISILQKPHMTQALITLEEAKSPSKFKSWWRPALGWISVIGLSLHFIIFPIIETIFIKFIRPDIDAASLMTLVLTLLGLGGMRTYEKFKGLTK